MCIMIRLMYALPTLQTTLSSLEGSQPMSDWDSLVAAHDREFHFLTHSAPGADMFIQFRFLKCEHSYSAEKNVQLKLVA